MGGGREITDPKTRARKEGPQFCDVFCTLRLGNIKYQTEIIKTSMNPVWQTSFEFPIDNCLILLLLKFLVIIVEW